MRTALLAGALALLAAGSAAEAGVRAPDASGCFPNQAPCPPRSDFLLSGQGAACHFRFRADGGLDKLTLTITLRDGFDQPVPDCSTSVTIEAGSGALALCSCCPLRQAGHSAADGSLRVVFSKLGGRGSLSLRVTAHCAGDIGMFEDEIPFTSPDLNGSCEAASSTNILDLGLWAMCLPPAPPCVVSDYDCSGTISLIDMAIWAGGLGRGCGGETCP